MRYRTAEVAELLKFTSSQNQNCRQHAIRYVRDA